MPDGSQPVHVICRNIRRQSGLTQSELARQAGCTQSAVSMFEAGRPEALAQDKVVGIAEILGIDIKSLGKQETSPGARVTLSLKYCPVDECPSNVPYVIRSQLCFKPAMVEALASESTVCGLCAEPLEVRCPNEACRASLREGGFCWKCGSPYVTPACDLDGESLAIWAARQRRRIEALHELTETHRYRAPP